MGDVQVGAAAADAGSDDAEVDEGIDGFGGHVGEARGGGEVGGGPENRDGLCHRPGVRRDEAPDALDLLPVPAGGGEQGHVVPPGLLGSLAEQVEHVAGETSGEVVDGTDGCSPGRVVAGPDEEGHVTDGQSSERHAVQVGKVEPGRRPGHEEQRRGRGTPPDRGLQERERLGARLVGVLHDDDTWAAPGADDGVGEGVGGCVVEDGAVDPGAAFRAGCLHPPLPQEGVASVPEALDRLDDRPVVVPLVDESPDGGGDERGLPHARGPSTRTVEGPTG